MSKNKKKQKPYYKMVTNKEVNENKNKDLTKNTTFMLGVGFILAMYSKYISDKIFSRIGTISGLVIMLYGIYNSIKSHREKETVNKIHYIIDYSAGAIIVLAILFNIYILFTKII